ncbi:hypothetical protein Tco_1512099 [Tanacetum coccineum]
MNAARPISYLSKKAHSTVKRPIHKNTTFKNSNFNQRVNTVKDKNVNIVRPKSVVNAVKGNNVNAVKASTYWVWKPKTNVLDYGNSQIYLQDQRVIDSGCSRHMTGNMSYLTDYKEIDGGYVAFGGNPKGGKITGKGTIKTSNLDFENVYFVRELMRIKTERELCKNRQSDLVSKRIERSGELKNIKRVEYIKNRQSDLVSKRIERSGINLLLLLKVNAARHNLLLLVKVNAARHNLLLLGETQMANLKFADTHNMVMFLSKPTESKGFEQIVDFLNANPIKYALTINPTIYISCIEQFWATVKAKTINREVQLQALVYGKKIIITESNVKRDL